jgi:hypothetical protein
MLGSKRLSGLSAGAAAAILAVAMGQPARATTNFYVDLAHTSPDSLHVSMSLAGFTFDGDVTGGSNGEPNGADFSIGAPGGYYPEGFEGTNDTSPGLVAINTIFWLEPGSSINNLADARFAVLALANGHEFMTPVLTEVRLSDAFTGASDISDALYGSCFGDLGPVRCPILSNGQSLVVPLLILFPNSGSEHDTLTVSFREDSGAPEPESWTLVLLGFGLAGGLLRGHQRRFRAA